jgi:hypothetical protein
MVTATREFVAHMLPYLGVKCLTIQHLPGIATEAHKLRIEPMPETNGLDLGTYAASRNQIIRGMADIMIQLGIDEVRLTEASKAEQDGLKDFWASAPILIDQSQIQVPDTPTPGAEPVDLDELLPPGTELDEVDKPEVDNANPVE